MSVRTGAMEENKASPQGGVTIFKVTQGSEKNEGERLRQREQQEQRPGSGTVLGGFRVQDGQYGWSEKQRERVGGDEDRGGTALRPLEDFGLCLE